LLFLYARSCDIDSYPHLSNFQAVNDPSKPLAELKPSERDRIGTSVAKTIREYQTWTEAGSQFGSSDVATPPEEQDEKGFLEYKNDSTEAMEEMNAKFNVIAALTSEVGDKLKSHEESISSLMKKGGDNSKIAMGLVNAAALDINGYAVDLESEVPHLEALVKGVRDNLLPWLTWRKSEGYSTDNAEFATSIKSLVDAAGPAIKQMEGFRDSTSGLRGASRPMNRAANRARAILDQLIGVMRQVQVDGNEYLSLV
jgi:hypothetical protein